MSSIYTNKLHHPNFHALKIKTPVNSEKAEVLTQFLNRESQSIKNIKSKYEGVHITPPETMLKAVSERQKDNPYDIVIGVGHNKKLPYENSVKISLVSQFGEVIQEADVYNSVQTLPVLGSEKPRVVSFFSTVIEFYEKLANKYNLNKKNGLL